MENNIIKFLLGEDSLDGVWFGEKHPTEQGNFWWRKHLRQFIEQNQALRIHDVVGQSEQLPDYEEETKCPDHTPYWGVCSTCGQY
jgi:hypothetical protein